MPEIAHCWLESASRTWNSSSGEMKSRVFGSVSNWELPSFGLEFGVPSNCSNDIVCYQFITEPLDIFDHSQFLERKIRYRREWDGLKASYSGRLGLKGIEGGAYIESARYFAGSSGISAPLFSLRISSEAGDVKLLF